MGLEEKGRVRGCYRVLDVGEDRKGGRRRCVRCRRRRRRRWAAGAAGGLERRGHGVCWTGIYNGGGKESLRLRFVPDQVSMT